MKLNISKAMYILIISKYTNLMIIAIYKFNIKKVFN